MPRRTKRGHGQAEIGAMLHRAFTPMTRQRLRARTTLTSARKSPHGPRLFHIARRAGRHMYRRRRIYGDIIFMFVLLAKALSWNVVLSLSAHITSRRYGTSLQRPKNTAQVDVIGTARCAITVVRVTDGTPEEKRRPAIAIYAARRVPSPRAMKYARAAEKTRIGVGMMPKAVTKSHFSAK